jgi:hypothetical protein
MFDAGRFEESGDGSDGVSRLYGRRCRTPSLVDAGYLELE